MITINTASDLDILVYCASDLNAIRAFAGALTDEDGNFIGRVFCDRIDDLRDMLVQLRCDLSIAATEGWDD